jgi:hypothetical protein
MFCEPFAISRFVNGIAQANIIVDSGCLSYALCDSWFARRNGLERILVSPLRLEGFDGSKDKVATKVAILDIDLNGYSERIFAYITPLSGHDIFLDLPWVYKRNVYLQGNQKTLRIGTEGPLIRSRATQEDELSKVNLPCLVLAVAFARTTRARGKRQVCQVFAASLADINKVLRKSEALLE